VTVFVVVAMGFVRLIVFFFFVFFRVRRGGRE
jgi:hypothetical protein